jgi:hypothetical protein
LSGNPEVGLPPEHPTLPSLLKSAGYGTSLIGKISQLRQRRIGLKQNNVCSLSHRRLTRPIDDIR